MKNSEDWIPLYRYQQAVERHCRSWKKLFTQTKIDPQERRMGEVESKKVNLKSMHLGSDRRALAFIRLGTSELLQIYSKCISVWRILMPVVCLSSSFITASWTVWKPYLTEIQVPYTLLRFWEDFGGFGAFWKTGRQTERQAERERETSV